MPKVLIRRDENGDVKIPKEFLDPSETVFSLERQGKTLWLKSASLKLHEIKDPEKRVEAFREFMKNFAHETGVNWPDNYNIRDDIYD